MTDLEKVRLLIGDREEELFDDDEINAFLEISDDSVYLAAALALDTLAASAAAEANSFTLGDYSVTGASNKGAAYKNQADQLRKLEYETPAFAIAEENHSEFNALLIIRNYILRNEG